MKTRIKCEKILRLINLFLLIITTFHASAQNANPQKKIFITGTIRRTNNEPIPLLSLVLIRSKDSSIIKGTITDEEGKFSLATTVESTNYSLYVSALNSVKLIKKLTFSELMSDSLVNLGNIFFEENEKTLEEITVNGKRPLLVRKLDKLEFDVSNSVLANGYDALEILSKLPGVVVSSNGDISVNGKGDIYLLIDGNGRYMNKEQIQSILENLRSDNILRIEIRTNPSAKYDAQGSMIINIITKQEKNKSSAHLTYGNQFYPVPAISGFNFPLLNSGFNLNYRIGKFKTSLTADYSQSHEFRNSDQDKLILPSNGLDREGRSVTSYKEIACNYQLGINYDLTKKSNLDFFINSFIYPKKEYFSEDFYNYYNASNRNLDSSYSLTGKQTNNKANFGSIIGNYTLNIDTLGKKLYFVFDYSSFANPSSQISSGTFFNGANILTKFDHFNFNRRYNVHIYSAHVDYEQPIKGNGIIEAGIKTTESKSVDKSILSYNASSGGTTVTEQNNSFKPFTYLEYISALYLNIQKKIGNLMVQIGLRGEGTKSEVFREGSNTYFNLFPSTTIQYNNKIGQFAFLFSRRIIRPSFSDFNPNNNYTTVLTSTQGSQTLTPKFQNNFELNYLLKSYYLSIGFSKALHPRIDLPAMHQDSGITISRYVTNLAFSNNLSVTLSLPIKIAPWWQTFTNLSSYGYYYKLLNQTLRTNWFFNVNTNNTYTLNKKNRIEMNYYFNSGSLYAYSKIFASSNLSVGYKYIFPNEKLEFGISLNDILGTDKLKMISDYGYQFEESRSLKNSRSIRVSLNYSFNTGLLFSLRNNSSKNDFGEKRF